MQVSKQRRDFFLKKKGNTYSIFEPQVLNINIVIDSKVCTNKELKNSAGFYKSNSYKLLASINSRSTTNLLNNPNFLNIKNGNDPNGHHIIFKRVFNRLNNY